MKIMGKQMQALMVIFILAFGALMMLLPVSADTDPGNDVMSGADTAVTDGTANAGTLTQTDTVDWFKIPAASLTGGTTGASNITVELNTTTSGMTPWGGLSVHTKDGFLIWGIYEMGAIANTTFWFYSLDGEDLYIKCTSAGTAAMVYYNFSIDIAAEDNPYVDTNNDPATAQDIVSGTQYDSWINTTRDYLDIYKFTGEAGGQLDFTLNHEADEEFLLNLYYFNSTNEYEPLGLNSHSKGSTQDTGYVYLEMDTTYYFIVSAARYYAQAGALDGCTGDYDINFTIAPNDIPSLSSAGVTPNPITFGEDVTLDLTCWMFDTDDIVEHYATCPLWSGELNLSNGGFGGTYTGSIDILAANITDTNDKVVTFYAEDEWGDSDTTTFNITIVTGNEPPVLESSVTEPYVIALDEDAIGWEEDLALIVVDDDEVNLTWKFVVDGANVDDYTGDNFTAAFDESNITIALTPDGFGDEELTINVSDADHFLNFNISVEIAPVNDVPTWVEIEETLPGTTKTAIVFGTPTEIAVDEDETYNFTIHAADVEMEELTFSSNETNDRLMLSDNGNVTFYAAQADVGLVEFWVNVEDASTGENDTLIVFNVSNVNDAPGAPGLSVDEADGLVNLTITAPVDEDGETVYTYEIDWNDGGPKETIEDQELTTFYVEHQYADAGLYTINVTVKDAESASNFALADELNITVAGGDDDDDVEPPTGEAVWWDTEMFEKADKVDGADASLSVSIDKLEIKTVTDTSGDPVVSTITYNFEGSCSSDITTIYLYLYSDAVPGYEGYTPFTDPDDYTEKIEVDASGGSWSWTLTATQSISKAEYDAAMKMLEDLGIETDEVVETYLAVGWTDDGKYAMDEKTVTWGEGGSGGGDDDDDDGILGNILAGGAIVCGLLILIPVVFIILIIVLIVVLVKRSKKKKAEAAAAEAPAGEPPIPEGGEVQYDEFGNPLPPQPTGEPGIPAEPGMEQPGEPGMVQPTGDPGVPAEPGMEQPGDPGMVQPTDDYGAAPAPADPGMAQPGEPGMVQPTDDYGAAPTPEAPADPAAAPPAPDAPAPEMQPMEPVAPAEQPPAPGEQPPPPQ